MTRKPLPLVARVSIAAWIVSLAIVTVSACPGRDETRPPDGPGPADAETGTEAKPAADE